MLFPGNTDYTGRHAGELVLRRPLWPRLLRLLPILLILALLAWPFIEPLCPQVEQVTLVSTDLPAAIGELRVVYVSDIHGYNPQRLVQRLNALNADLVLLGGDYADDSQSAADFFRALPRIHSRYGVYAVMGNHDRTAPESNLTALTSAMEAAGVTPLVNTAVPVRIGSHSIWLAGLDDVSNGHPDLTALTGKVQKGDYVIFLSHSPAIIPQALEARDASGSYGWFDLGLFGHTHSGQIGLFGGINRDDSVPENYRSGWRRVNRIDLLTSRGYGTSVLPVRILCRPQIHVITIQAAP